MSLRFAELPSGRTDTNVWGEEAKALRSNPGKWAHFEELDDKSAAYNGSLAHNIKRGILKSFRDGKFEARVVKGQLWARFVGDAE